MALRSVGNLARPPDLFLPFPPHQGFCSCAPARGWRTLQRSTCTAKPAVSSAGLLLTRSVWWSRVTSRSASCTMRHSSAGRGAVPQPVRSSGTTWKCPRASARPSGESSTSTISGGWGRRSCSSRTMELGGRSASGATGAPSALVGTGGFEVCNREFIGMSEHRNKTCTRL